MTTVIDFHRLTEDGVFGEITPIIKDEDERAVCRFVWENYASYTDSSLVTILHAKDTPWSKFYEEGANKEIPDDVTKAYYKDIIKRTLES
jgi:phage protein